MGQTMTEAEHNRPIPKLFSNRPSASAAEVFALLREPIIFLKITCEILLNLNFILNCNPNPLSRGLNFWKIKLVNVIKVQFSHGLVKN